MTSTPRTGWLGSVSSSRRGRASAASGDGHALSIGGTTYAKGLGTHAPSEVTLSLGGRCTTFDASVGLDDETTSVGSVAFQVLADGQLRYDSGVVNAKNPALGAKADITGARTLTLRVTDGGDGKNFDHADWADARLTCAS